MQEGEESYRLYSCRGCNVSVSICGPCDHGNIFVPASARPCRAAHRTGAPVPAINALLMEPGGMPLDNTWRARQRDKVTQQGCAPVGAVFTMSITVDVAAIEMPDARCTPEETNTAPPRRDHDGQHPGGRCAFCHAPLPAFTRLRTRRG